MRLRVILILLAAALSVSCGRGKHNDTGNAPETVAKGRSVYHWKTTFGLTPEDTLFIRRHGIQKIYLRMFDVGVESADGQDNSEVVPMGTTRFIARIPKGCSYIPTVYITLKALKAYDGHEEELAELIIRRIYAMHSWNELGRYREIQYDCDWTAETKASFERLCTHSKKMLAQDGIILSGTIRIHQIEEATYPFDKGVIMMYNTGSFVNPHTRNSIIDYSDVHKYLSNEKRIETFLSARKDNCPVIEIAYPTYGWGVVFDENGKFSRLVSNPKEPSLEEGETMRIETSSYSEIMKVKSLVDSTIGRASSGNIIYHLDPENLSRYESHEIEDILN